MTIEQMINKKKAGQKIVMLTAYDYPLASLIDQAGVDIILVGDSLANVVLGLESTQEIGMSEMIHHAKAVRRAVKQALLVGDMPFGSYQKGIQDALMNAQRFIDEAGCDAVKLEWFDPLPIGVATQSWRGCQGCLDVVEALVKAKIPVMGHVGLTPQTADRLGGFKVQGKDALSARRIIENAKALEAGGCFSMVLECVPSALAQMITQQLSIPTIGIGAGLYCDGQVLVTHDLLGLGNRFKPKFVKQYVNVSDMILAGIKRFQEEVVTGTFPDADHSYSIDPTELNFLKGEK